MNYKYVILFLLITISIIAIGIVSASELEDKLGHGLTLTNSGCAYNSTGFLSCWDSDYLRAPNGILPYSTSNIVFSIQVRYRFNLTSGGMSDSNAGYLFSDNTTFANLYCRIYYSPSAVRFRTCTVGTVAMRNFGDNNSNSPNVWHDLVLTYNSTHACLYFDGGLDDCNATNFKGINYSNSYLMFANNDALTRGGDVDLDIIRTWNTSLSSGNVYSLWINSTNVQTHYRLAYYDFINNTCTIPSMSATNNLGSSTTLCNEVYDFTPYTAFAINTSSNMFLDCNGSTINQPIRHNSSRAILIETNAGIPDIDNITVKNCIITGWGNGIYLVDFTGGSMSEGTYIYNNIIKNSGDLAGIYTMSSNNFYIYNNTIIDNTFYGLRNIGAHGIYMSGSTSRCPNAGETYNNLIYNVTTGIKINPVDACRIKNIKIYNNVIHDLHVPSAYDWDDIGVHLVQTDNVSIYNNQISNLTFSTTKLGVYINWNSTNDYTTTSSNTRIYNNTFNNMEVAVLLKKGFTNISVYNNNYTQISRSAIQLNDTGNIDVYETSNMTIQGTVWNAYLLYLPFVGIKNFSINNMNFTAYNGLSQWSTNNDVKNYSNNVLLATNFDSYSIILSAEQQINVGDYTNIIGIIFNVVPVNNSFIDMNYVFINTTTTGTSFSNTTIYLYNSSGLYDSNLSTLNITSHNFTSLPDENYHINVTSYDTAGDLINSETINFTIDTTTPSISFQGQTPGDTVTVTGPFTINISSSDTNLNYTVFNIYDATGLLVQSNNAIIITFSYLANGIYYYNATNYDLTGHHNDTATRSISVNVNSGGGGSGYTPATCPVGTIQNGSYCSIITTTLNAANTNETTLGDRIINATQEFQDKITEIQSGKNNETMFIIIGIILTIGVFYTIKNSQKHKHTTRT